MVNKPNRYWQNIGGSIFIVPTGKSCEQVSNDTVVAYSVGSVLAEYITKLHNTALKEFENERNIK